MNVGIISKDKGAGDLKAKAGEEEWSADSEPDSPPSPGQALPYVEYMFDPPDQPEDFFLISFFPLLGFPCL